MFITHDKFKPKNIRYGFYTKAVPYIKTAREESLKSASKHFGSEDLSVMQQKHTNDVVIVNDYQSSCVADGQVTNKPSIALGVLTADCVPILLADETLGVISTVHAGWRGARANIMQEAIDKMKALGAENITAIIGPCIRQHSYEVGNELYKNFLRESASYKKLFIPSVKSNHYMFNLPKYVKDKLSEVGISNILDVNRNTYEEEDKFFSYRRSTHNPNSPMGNIISIIMLT
jgi:polyphenol oxidase